MVITNYLKSLVLPLRVHFEGGFREIEGEGGVIGCGILIEFQTETDMYVGNL